MGSRTKHIMSEEEKYFFDLRGYLVVRRALTAEEVTACNGAIDHFVDRMSTRSVEGGGLADGSSALAGESGRQELGGMLGWPAPHRHPTPIHSWRSQVTTPSSTHNSSTI